MAKTTPKYKTGPGGIPFGPGHPLYDPAKDDGPRTYIGDEGPTELSKPSTDEVQAMIDAYFGNQPDFSNFMTAADAEELFRNMDTGQIEAGVLQKMGVPDFLTNTQVQEAINQALGATDFLSEEDIARMIAQQTDQINALMPDLSGVLSQEQIQQMIANAQMQGMTEDQILKMIQEATGGQMSDDAIRELIAQTIADATAGVPGMDEIQRMIDEGLANGLSPEQINQMIAEYLASNPMEGITAETVQQMIADAIAAAGGGESGEGGMSMEDIQALLDSGYMTADQINALMSDAGYLGQEGVDSSVQAALDAALGEGGAINSAIAAAMQSQGGGQTPPPDTDMNFTQPYTPGSFPTNPYGEVNPYALMQGQFAGTTPYSGGATTGAEMPTGLGTLNLGDPSQYNFDIPTTPGADLYPSGTDPRYFNPPTPDRRLPEPPTTPPEESGYRLPPDFFNTYGG